MKGIILAGGFGTRLFPMTKSLSKQILPLYDKPLVYYPLSTLMLAGIKDILIISTERDTPMYQDLLGDGSRLGINLEYMVQKYPRGLAEAFILGEKFIGKDSVCLVLGDNFFYGHGFSDFLKAGECLKEGGMVLAYAVKDPRAFGVIEVDDNNKVVSIEEKPQNPKSNLAVPGLYFFDNEVIKIAKTVKPSLRGEIEITSVIQEYINRGKLKAVRVGRGLAWLDTGTPKAMNDASNFIESVQNSQGYYIACLEEIAYNQGFIDYQKLMELGEELKASDYGKYILSVEEKKR